MVDLKTAIEEINTGKIEFDYRDDSCCTTPGEVVILLKRLEYMESELAEAEKAFEIAVRCGRELNGTPELKEAYDEAQRDNRALNAFREFCLQKAREELQEKGVVKPEKPCEGCKFDVARKLLSKVVDDRFTEEMREFLLLVLENPELPVVPMVYTDCVGGDEYSYWLSKVGRSEIREFAIDEWYHDGKVVYRDDANAEEDLVEAIAETKYNGSLMDYEKAEAEAAGLWTKAIIVYITTP